VAQRTDAAIGGLQHGSERAPSGAGKTAEEIAMSKGKHGNKEAKKPKQVPADKPSPGSMMAPLPLAGARAPQKK
jgi:hypothetical protein